MNLDRWEDRHVNLLICCWKEHKGLFNNGKTTKKEVFHKISATFNSKADLKVSADQCARKWAKLEAELKEVTDDNNKSGNSHKKWKYYTDMADCIGMNAAVKPTFTLESSAVPNAEGDESDSSADGHDEDSAGTSKKKTPKKRPARKRRSRSSASEMLSFLKEYQEKKEEVENKKVKIMEEMNEEKTIFWANLLQVMKEK